jgi:5,10-methylene-tetrahydrofolate dehydrogenase/methenyl tetrahydrofolate cyclohydrolase
MLSDDSKTEKFYDTAYIPNYCTSVMMNKLFRNIKENDNLDRLEESDDEDEFENENIDKFVYLEKTYPMICKYNYKFKKWYPVSLANKDAKIVNSAELQNK